MMDAHASDALTAVFQNPGAVLNGAEHGAHEALNVTMGTAGTITNAAVCGTSGWAANSVGISMGTTATLGAERAGASMFAGNVMESGASKVLGHNTR
jgi:hypothetical protein